MKRRRDYCLILTPKEFHYLYNLLATCWVMEGALNKKSKSKKLRNVMDYMDQLRYENEEEDDDFA